MKRQRERDGEVKRDLLSQLDDDDNIYIYIYIYIYICIYPTFNLIGWLGVWVLWRINLCRLFKFCLYVYTFNQKYLNEYLVGKIFYKQDFICLHMINQF